MVVDDDPALLGFTCKYLSRLGYSVTPYRSAEEAWKHFDMPGAPFALALIDFSLSGLSGERLSRLMLDANPEVRLILTSGYPFDMENLFQTTSDRLAFLHKPFTPAMLAETIDKLIGASKKNAD
jgi:two-component system cell cycle sensor histidine kinase/response regulator CckA